jgi:hypothetical protein
VSKSNSFGPADLLKCLLVVAIFNQLRVIDLRPPRLNAVETHHTITQLVKMEWRDGSSTEE